MYSTCSWHKPINAASNISYSSLSFRTHGCWNIHISEPPSLPYIILSNELLYRCLHVRSQVRITCAVQNQLFHCNPCILGGGSKIKQICLSKLFIKELYPRYNPNILSRAGDFVCSCSAEFQVYWVVSRGIRGKGYCNFLNNTKADFIIKRLNRPSGRKVF